MAFNPLTPTPPPVAADVNDLAMKDWFQKMWTFIRRINRPSGAKSASFTLDDSYFVPVSAAGGAVTITVPPAITWAGKPYVIKKTDSTANAITLTASGADTLDGSATYVMLGQYSSVTLYSDGISTWHVQTHQAYRTGSWTPAYLASGGGLSVTYGNQNGNWVKIGRMVHCIGRIDLSVLTSPGIGSLQLQTLPFATTASDKDRGGGVVYFTNGFGATAHPASLLVDQSATTATLFKHSGTDARSSIPTAVAVADLTATAQLLFSVTYFTDT